MKRTSGWLFFIGVIATLLFVIDVLPASARVDWLPISPSDLALKSNPKQPGADAMILYRENVIDTRTAGQSGDTVENYERIKIFTQAGTKYGHVEIDFDKDWENVPYVAGRTILPDGSIHNFNGKVLETTIVKTGGETVDAKTFTLPDVVPGCIIEYRDLRQASPGYVHETEWLISSNMFTRDAHFAYFYGHIGLTPLYREYGLPASIYPTRQANGSFTMSVHNIPATVDEPLMPPLGMIQPRVEFYYQQPGEPSPSTPTNKYWNHYAKHWEKELDHFIDKKKSLDQALAKIVSPGESPEGKLRKIYARVLQIRNLSLESPKTQVDTKAENLRPDKNAQDVLDRGYATRHQINLLFVGLARAAGFDAGEVYLVPRNTALFRANNKDADQLSADVVWAHAGSRNYYLDPGARYYPFGLLPWYETDAGGVRADRHSAVMATTATPTASDATIVRTADLRLHIDGSVSGTLQIDFTGREGALLRVKDRDADATGRSKDLQNRIEQWLAIRSSFKVTKIDNWNSLGRPVHVEGTFNAPSLDGSLLGTILLPADIFRATQASAFTSQRRVNDIYFHFPYEEVDDVKLRLPAGYKVDFLPKSRKIDLGALSYTIAVSAQGNQVEVKRRLAENGVIFLKKTYPSLRAFFGAVGTDDRAKMAFEASLSKTN